MFRFCVQENGLFSVFFEKPSFQKHLTLQQNQMAQTKSYKKLAWHATNRNQLFLARLKKDQLKLLITRIIINLINALYTPTAVFRDCIGGGGGICCRFVHETGEEPLCKLSQVLLRLRKVTGESPELTAAPAQDGGRLRVFFSGVKHPFCKTTGCLIHRIILNVKSQKHKNKKQIKQQLPYDQN